MSVSFFKIKKWLNMMIGNSVYHVHQGEGLIYSRKELKGYYNNLTEKVTKFGLKNNDIHTTVLDSGEEVYFPIAIFQYGLGAYDLYLINNDRSMFEKAESCAKWAVENQEHNGGWKTFTQESPQHPYSSMAQGEAISLLVRIYKETKVSKYIESAKRAIDMMLLKVEEGGTAKYNDFKLCLYECTDKPLILNGWIFSAWGLLDYFKVTKDKVVLDKYNQTVLTISMMLPEFDIGYWSKYDCKKIISSPFYHNLHIAQLRVMFKLTNDNNFKLYADKFACYNDSLLNKTVAFCRKAIQKIKE